MAKREGSVWIEGNYFHFVDDDNVEWRFLGDYVANPSGAREGSIWVELQHTHYITASGTERRMPGLYISSGSGQRKGSVWFEDTPHTDYTVGHYDTPGQTFQDHVDSGHGDVSSQTHIDTTNTSWTKPFVNKS